MSLMKKAYASIKTKIVNCDYLPDTFLNEAELMKELDVSRTPIREAMSRLEQENLVRIIPKKGIIVSSLSLSNVKELYQVRELLEPYIIRHWGAQVAPEILVEYQNKLRKTSQETPERERYLIDYELHRIISDKCENQYFVQLLGNVYDQNHRIRILSGKLHRRLEETRTEHLSIVERLLGGDADGAAKAMEIHLENSRKAAFESLMLSRF
jgi:GntR family transcriptional regulator, rspAB operon transcriptional repressor